MISSACQYCLPGFESITTEDTVQVKISTKSAKLLFKPCKIDYIKTVCHGRCCNGSNGLSVAINQYEEASIKQLGVKVVDGLIVANDKGLCPFKDNTGLCKLHTTAWKPFGCIASPFTLNNNNTLIVRNRYKLLRCYKNGTIPAYKNFSMSLYLLFGNQTQKLIEHLDKYSDDLTLPMGKTVYQKLIENTHTRKRNSNETT